MTHVVEHLPSLPCKACEVMAAVLASPADEAMKLALLCTVLTASRVGEVTRWRASRARSAPRRRRRVSEAVSEDEVFGLLGAALARGPLETFVVAFDALRALAVSAPSPSRSSP